MDGGLYSVRIDKNEELNFNKSCTNQKSHISSNKGSKLNYQSKRCIYLAQTKVNDLEHNRGKNDFQKSK